MNQSDFPISCSLSLSSSSRRVLAARTTLFTIYLFICINTFNITATNAFVVISPTHQQSFTPRTIRSKNRAPTMPPPSLELMLMTSSLNEKVLEKLPSKPVVDAVIESKTETIIASDVATRAGVSLSQARKDLTTLASLSQGDISVSKDGELLYEFPNDLNSVLSSNSAKYKARQAFEKAWPLVFTGIRATFGVALVASVVLVFSAIIVLQTSGGSSDDDRRRDDRRGGGMSFGGGFGGFWGPSPFDFFFYRPYGSYGYYGTGNEAKDPEEMGFLESVFSFVFGGKFLP